MTRQLEATWILNERTRLLRVIAIDSPESWAHFNLLGKYHFCREKLQNYSGMLPPNLPSRSSRKTGNPKPVEKKSVPKGYEKVHSALRTLVGLRPSSRRGRKLQCAI